MFIEQPTAILRHFYKSAMWRKEPEKKTVYLTFDDGPVPEVTPWVLDKLKEYGISATFFCVGENVQKYPELFERIKAEGHSVGNHTFNHITGFNSNYDVFLKNIEEADVLIQSKLFRPPHGHLTRGQCLKLKEKYQIVMWDVITRDYNQALKPEKVFAIATKYTRNGSLVVFHDSLKAEKNMKYAMPKTVEYLLEKGYTFDKL